MKTMKNYNKNLLNSKKKLELEEVEKKQLQKKASYNFTEIKNIFWNTVCPTLIVLFVLYRSTYYYKQIFNNKESSTEIKIEGNNFTSAEENLEFTPRNLEDLVEINKYLKACSESMYLEEQDTIVCKYFYYRKLELENKLNTIIKNEIKQRHIYEYTNNRSSITTINK